MTFKPNKGREAVRGIKVLLMGPPKSFKTGASATAPKPWFADFDAGIATALGVNPEVQYGSEDWPYYRDDDEKAVKKGASFTQFLKDLEDVKQEASIETIVVDSATLMYDMAMNKALQMNGRPGQPIPEQRDWLLQMRLCRDVFQFLTAIPDKNVIVTAHVEMREDKVTGRNNILPLLTGKDATKAPAYFDCFFCSEMVRNKETKLFEPVIRTQPTMQMNLGSRYLGLEEYEKPDFGVIFDKIHAFMDGKKGESEVPKESITKKTVTN